jgi:hypothetical protein
VFEPRVACGSQGERSSGRAGKENAMTPKIALGRPMRSGLRMEEDSLLNSRMDGLEDVDPHRESGMMVRQN